MERRSDSRTSREAKPGRLAALRSALACSIRSLPLLVARRPKTPLRVLCVVAFDTLEVVAHSTRLTSDQVQSLCWFLDFAACANAWWDGKEFDVEEFETTKRQLEQTGYADLVHDYLIQLREHERHRPLVRRPEPTPVGEDRRDSPSHGFHAREVSSPPTTPIAALWDVPPSLPSSLSLVARRSPLPTTPIAALWDVPPILLSSSPLASRLSLLPSPFFLHPSQVVPPGASRLAATRAYREGVAKLSLRAIEVLLSRQRVAGKARSDVASMPGASIHGASIHGASMQEDLDAKRQEAGMELLFRLTMLCQLIDDVVDYRADRAAGLPSFLTAAGTVRRSLVGANMAATSYLDRGVGNEPGLFPFRLARSIVGASTRLVLWCCGWWYRHRESRSGEASERFRAAASGFAVAKRALATDDRLQWETAVRLRSTNS